MLSKYFTRVEDRFVFNVALLFWHLLVLIAAVAILVGIGMFIWSRIPARKPIVVEQSYPPEPSYPEPVRVTLDELHVEDIRRERSTIELEATIPQPAQSTPSQSQSAQQEDLSGLREYEAEYERLKGLVPPTSYSWEGQGYWSYPFGQRYWDVYKQERYRQWVVTAPGFSDVLKQALQRSKAKRYTDKQRLLKGLNNLAEAIPEGERMKVLKDIISQFADNVDLNVQTLDGLVVGINQIGNVGSYDYVRLLAEFGRYNPADLKELSLFLSRALNKFRAEDQLAILSRVIDSYYRVFDRNLVHLKEATEMFLPLLSEIDPALHVTAITRYHSLYLNKNQRRNLEVARINQEHQQRRAKVDEENRQAHLNAEASLRRQLLAKEDAMRKSAYAVGAGIMLVIVVATILVFFSIQRLVKKIEQRIPLVADDKSSPL